VADPVVMCCAPNCVPCHICRSNRSAVITEICQNILTLHVPPFKVTQGHWNRHGSIGFFLLMIHSRPNYGPISHRFRDKRRFLSKIANFSNPRMLNAPVKRIPLWNFVTAVALVMLLPDGGNSLAICAFISIQYQTVTDRPTHRFAITVSRSAC